MSQIRILTLHKQQKFMEVHYSEQTEPCFDAVSFGI